MVGKTSQQSVRQIFLFPNGCFICERLVFVFSSRNACALLCSLCSLAFLYRMAFQFGFDFINILVLHLRNLLLYKSDKARFVLQKQLNKFPLLISKEISIAEVTDLFHRTECGCLYLFIINPMNHWETWVQVKLELVEKEMPDFQRNFHFQTDFTSWFWRAIYRQH